MIPLWSAQIHPSVSNLSLSKSWVLSLYHTPDLSYPRLAPSALPWDKYHSIEISDAPMPWETVCEHHTPFADRSLASDYYDDCFLPLGVQLCMALTLSPLSLLCPPPPLNWNLTPPSSSCFNITFSWSGQSDRMFPITKHLAYGFPVALTNPAYPVLTCDFFF